MPPAHPRCACAVEYIEVDNSKTQNEIAGIDTNELSTGEFYGEMRNAGYDISQYSDSNNDVADNGQQYQNVNLPAADEKTQKRNFNEPHEPRTQKEFLNVANAWQIQMDELGIRESKWKGDLYYGNCKQSYCFVRTVTYKICLAL